EVKTSTAVEAIGVKIMFTNSVQITFISVYVPKGDCDTEEVAHLINHNNDFITAGDFNGHHTTWETDVRPNKAGRSIYEALIQVQNACLITPKDLRTRVDPSTGKQSTIDLTFVSPRLAATATVRKGPHLGSDHFPLITTLNATPNKISGRPSTWILNDKKWGTWNQCIESYLGSKNFAHTMNPEMAMQIFSDALEKANEENFKKSRSEGTTNQEPRRPWWNEDCANLVKNARKSYRTWRKFPLSTVARSEWTKAEAKKKKGILAAKRQAWTNFISDLGPKDQTKMWSFVRSMTGKGTDPTPDGRPINNNGMATNDPSEKAEVFVNFFSSAHPTGIPNNTAYQETICRQSRLDTQNTLNDQITIEEIEKCLPKSKSNAVGKDLVNNQMLR
ncbi:Uncharacterized protein APZ42_008980, partial [Daphnia magna]